MSGHGSGGVGQPVEVGGAVVFPAVAGEADRAEILIYTPLVEGRGLDTIRRQNFQRGAAGDEF